MNFKSSVLLYRWLLVSLLLLAVAPLTEAQAFKNSETTTQYSYDELGLLASYEDDVSRGAYTYDALGRLTATTVTYKSAPTAFSKTFSYRYDANGRVTGYTNPEDQAYDYRYTAHGQLAALSLPGEGTLSYQDYAWLTPRAVLFPGGTAWELTYDGLLRQVLRTLKDPAGRTLLDYRYTYDAAGNLVTLGSPQGDTRYQYDTRYQLTEARYPSGDGRTAEAYVYDGVGNRLDQQATTAELDPIRWRYNAFNQLVSRNGIGYRYDQDGHLIEQGTLQGDGTLGQGSASPYWTYRYDGRGRLAEVRKNATLVATYRYDPLGRRLSKTLPDQGLTTFYLYNQQGLAAEYTAAGQLIQEYGYDPTAAWMSQPLFTRAKRKDTGAWTVSYFGTSHLGTPEVAFDKRGTLTWQATAQAFGATRVSRSLIDNPLRFPGQYWDAETGLHYNYFRDYDPQTGRYVQRDPLGLAAGIDSYGYALQDPISLTDPLGLFPPAAAVYARCIASCKAWGMLAQQLGIECDDPSIKDCALDCLNPTKWVKFKATKRPSGFRKKTVQDAWDKASPGEAPGSKACPTCGKDVFVEPGRGPRDWDVDHQPPWSKRKIPEGLSSKEVRDEFNKGTRLECPGCNRSRGAKPANE